MDDETSNLIESLKLKGQKIKGLAGNIRRMELVKNVERTKPVYKPPVIIYERIS